MDAVVMEKTDSSESAMDLVELENERDEDNFPTDGICNDEECFPVADRDNDKGSASNKKMVASVKLCV
jgi:hypothetical protein